MSRSAERRGDPRDQGFSLIEIVVALGILSIVMVALLPQLVIGIKATGTGRLVSQAKGVSQGELERMRNLPFHITPSAGEYVDVLDYYYRNLSSPGTTPVCKNGALYATPTVGWSGYVAPGNTARCDYEPSSGAFYRKVTLVPAAAGIASFTVVVDTQFLSGATPPAPVTPPSDFNTQTVGKDNPAASQIGVTVTVLYQERGTLKPVTTYTQISERLPTVTRVRSEVGVRVLEVGSAIAGPVPLSLSAGLLDLTGSVSYSSTVNANLTAVSAGLATGEQGAGAKSTLSAPPSSTSTASPVTEGMLTVGGCSYACWGGTTVSGFHVAAADGLPVAGSATAPAQALLTGITNSGLSFGNTTTAGDYRSALDLAPPLLRLDPTVAGVPSGLSGCAVGGGGTSSYVSASGYLRTTAPGTSSVVESCAVARTTAVELFPTTFAPRGVVRVTLEKAVAQCLVQGSARVASTNHDFRAVVEYYNGTDYTTAATVVPGTATEPLDSVPLTTSIGGTRTLGDYIASWSTLTTGKVTTTAANGVAKVTLPGVVTIASQPVRTAAAPATGVDEDSVVSVTVGALSCHAEDSR